MRRLLLALFLLAWGINGPIHSQEQKKTTSAHYLFAWTGDAANKRAGCSANCGAEGREGSGNDFLAVIDADPSSPSYGHLVTTVADLPFRQRLQLHCQFAFTQHNIGCHGSPSLQFAVRAAVSLPPPSTG